MTDAITLNPTAASSDAALGKPSTSNVAQPSAEERFTRRVAFAPRKPTQFNPGPPAATPDQTPMGLLGRPVFSLPLTDGNSLAGKSVGVHSDATPEEPQCAPAYIYTHDDNFPYNKIKYVYPVVEPLREDDAGWLSKMYLAISDQRMAVNTTAKKLLEDAQEMAAQLQLARMELKAELQYSQETYSRILEVAGGGDESRDSGEEAADSQPLSSTDPRARAAERSAFD